MLWRYVNMSQTFKDQNSYNSNYNSITHFESWLEVSQDLSNSIKVVSINNIWMWFNPDPIEKWSFAGAFYGNLWKLMKVSISNSSSNHLKTRKDVGKFGTIQ